MGVKFCTKCQTEKPSEDFYRNRSTPDGLHVLCKKCHKEWYDSTKQRSKSARWHRDNPNSARAAHLKKFYGITIDEFNRKLVEQGGVCAICKAKDPGGRSKFFHVDHDHRTGKIRMLLCDTCNRGLGFFKESPELLREAAAYLERF